MRPRRLFALLTSIAMLHLSVVAGDAACLTQGAERHHTATSSGATIAEVAMELDGHVMPMADARGAAVENGTRVARADVPPCELPTQPHCCEAVVGCSAPSAVTSERQLLVSRVAAAGQVGGAVDDAPSSFASSPEPPPPKA